MTRPSLLVTGGTGTFGRAYLRRAFASGLWRRVIAFSRDEVKMAMLADEFSACPMLRCFLGDVRDAGRLAIALKDVHTVIHAAALKRVDAGAYSPSELIATNILGTMNVVNEAIRAGVARVIVISSDKAVGATNLYGATKFCGELYAVQANAYSRRPGGTRIAAVRYGNILGSRGSVWHLWRDAIARGELLRITDERMTRFLMTVEHAVDLVEFARDAMWGGEVFLPKLPAIGIRPFAEAVNEAAGRSGDLIETSAIRPGGEKLAESLLNSDESRRTRDDAGDYLAIAPSHHEWTNGAEFAQFGSLVPETFTYRSDRPFRGWLSRPEVIVMIRHTEACR